MKRIISLELSGPKDQVNDIVRDLIRESRESKTELINLLGYTTEGPDPWEVTAIIAEPLMVKEPVRVKPKKRKKR